MRLEPLVDAVHVEVVPALALDRRTVLTRILALGARHLEGIHADDTVRVRDVPVPSGHRKPLVYRYLHYFSYLYFEFQLSFDLNK